MSFPRYPEYKDSGVEWLGEVPGHWESWKISHAFGHIGSGTTPPSNEPAWYDEGEIPWVTTGELRENVITCTAKGVTREAVERFGSLRIYPPGSLVVAMYGATIGRLGVLGIHAATNQACCVLASPASLAVRFVFHWLSAFKERLVDLYAYGGGQPNISQEVVASLRIPAPSIEEQLSIAAFLDRETAKIDALVAEQQNLIELLKEKRQALISHAVTKGLDPDVPMKDSGVAWLGEVPAHWEVLKLKHVSPEITVGIVVEPSKYYCETGVPALRSLNVKPGSILLENLVFISEEANEALAKSCLRAGDIVAVRSGQPGTSAVIPEELDGCNCIDLLIIRRPKKGSEHYLCWYLSSDPALRQFAEGSGGAIQQHFNVSTATSLRVATPPPAEQLRIDQFLRSEVSKFDALVLEAEATIDLLQERRTALISAAVTGKIDVRRLAAATSEPTPEAA